jgi:peptide-methionine (S)-S-oxide reductase
MPTMSLFTRKPAEMPTPETALRGRTEALPVNPTHFIFGNSMIGPFPDGSEQIMVGMGCFWGVERKFWDAPGIITTAVGYAAGYTENATYEEVCTGRTGHNEVVLAVFDPSKTSYDAMLKLFWENHDPTQGMRQGNDVGTQYRSGIYTYTEEQQAAALASKELFQAELTAARYGTITTEILPVSTFYYAETYHQQYLAKNPNGYCGVGGTGVSCPIGLARDRG